MSVRKTITASYRVSLSKREILRAMEKANVLPALPPDCGLTLGLLSGGRLLDIDEDSDLIVSWTTEEVEVTK